jgi:hypothetical protein
LQDERAIAATDGRGEVVRNGELFLKEKGRVGLFQPDAPLAFRRIVA